jgi:hypothetical protein
MTNRNCFREPIPEVADAARYLDAAVSAHLAARPDEASELIRRADMPAIRDWTESIWGKSSPYVCCESVPGLAALVPRDIRVADRMPTADRMRALLSRDHYHCRFCGIPVIRKEIRQRIVKTYPQSAPWGRRNIEQHAALQAMWAQYDHVLPHSKGGDSSLENMVIACAPCNFGRMEFALEEVGLNDPRSRDPIQSIWDGLERFP